MGEQKDWTQWIKDLPNWLKGLIGLVTVIATFIVLFQDNPYLIATVLVAVALGAALCGAAYVAFSKMDSPVVKGRRIYRFPDHYRWGRVGIVLISILVIGLLVKAHSYHRHDCVYWKRKTNFDI